MAHNGGFDPPCGCPKNTSRLRHARIFRPLRNRASPFICHRQRVRLCPSRAYSALGSQLLRSMPTKKPPLWVVFPLAQKEGFEPSRALYTPTPLAGEPLRPLGYFCTLLKDDIINQGPCQAVFAQDLAVKGCFVIYRHKNAGKYGLLHPPAQCVRSARPAHSLRPRSP